LEETMDMTHDLNRVVRALRKERASLTGYSRRPYSLLLKWFVERELSEGTPPGEVLATGDEELLRTPNMGPACPLPRRARRYGRRRGRTQAGSVFTHGS
jgi:hypothetical protein